MDKSPREIPSKKKWALDGQGVRPSTPRPTIRQLINAEKTYIVRRPVFRLTIKENEGE